MTTLTLSMHYKASAMVCSTQGQDLIFGVPADVKSESRGGKLQGYNLHITPKSEMGPKDRLVLLHDNGKDREFWVYNAQMEKIGTFSYNEVLKKLKTRGRVFVDVHSGGRQSVSVISRDNAPWGGITPEEVLVFSCGGVLDGSDHTYILPQQMREDDVLVLRFPSNHDARIKTYNHNGELVAEKYEWELMLEQALAGRPHLDLNFSYLEHAELAGLDEYQLPIKCVPAEKIDWNCWRGNNDNWKFSVVTAEPVKVGDHIAIHSWRVAGEPYGFDVITFYRFDGREFVEVQETYIDDLRKQTEASKLVASGEAEQQLQELEDELERMNQFLRSKRRELQGQPGWKLTQLENEYGDKMAAIRQKIYVLEDALGL